jgi:hypothetical protein
LFLEYLRRAGGSSRFLFPQASLPWYLPDSTSGLFVLENENEAETGGRQWKKEIGRSRRAQPYPEISSTASLTGWSGVFLYISTTDFNTALLKTTEKLNPFH